MSDGNRMTRRDWFRLRPLRAERDASPTDSANDAGRAMGEVSHGLRPIAHPENHDGMNLSELPPMREALLTEEQVRQLFSDIESLATDILLMQRTSRSQHATVSRATATEQLHKAQATLLSGAVTRVQIRYCWQAASWIDTLERRDDGFRLVRIAHQKSETS